MACYGLIPGVELAAIMSAQVLAGLVIREGQIKNYIPRTSHLNPALDNCYLRVREEEMVSRGWEKGFSADKSTHKLSIWPAGTALREGNK